jgi:microcystin-dependent protein
MPFSPLLVTNQGLEALAEVGGTGGTLQVTKVEAGSGYAVTGDIPGNFTSLKQYVMDCDSTSTNTEVLYQTTIRCNINEQNAPKTFQVNEFGVFASLNSQAPFLFAYASTGAPSGDTVDPSVPIIKEYVLPIVYSTLQSVTTTINMTDVVGLHAGTHLPNGIDPLPISTQTIGGLCPKTPNDVTQVLLGGATAGFDKLPLHGPTHVSSGRDPVPVATTGATGLLPKLSGDSNTVLLGTGAWGAGFFPGFVAEFGGTSPPPGWLLCDGQAYSRSTYNALFNALGGSNSPWGQGDGYSTFNVPDLRGRATIGAGGGAGLTYRPAGQKGGEETHLLSVAELASHTHGVNDPGHAHSVYDPTHAHAVSDGGHSHSLNDPGHAHAVYDPAHAHSLYDPTHAHGISDPAHAHGVYDPTHRHYLFPISQQAASHLAVPPNFGPLWIMWSASPQVDYSDYSATGIGIYAAATGVSVNHGATGMGVYTATTAIGIYAALTNITMNTSGSNTAIYGAYTGVGIYGAYTGVSIQNTGSNAAHNNMPPFAAINKIIKV